jgi:tetratricopeptide (TPR) repeat protein
MMAKRWKREEITYLKRYAVKRTLEELTARYQIDAEAMEAKLTELGLRTSDGRGKFDLSQDPIVQLFERGIKAVHEGKWSEAEKLLGRVVTESSLSEVAHRAEQYLTLVARRKGEPPKAEDPYLEAVVLHNQGDLDGAEAICLANGRAATDERFAYLAAAIAAVRGDYEAAAKRLETAIQLNPRNRIQAAEDLDFRSMREHEEFAALVT